MNNYLKHLEFFDEQREACKAKRDALEKGSPRYEYMIGMLVMLDLLELHYRVLLRVEHPELGVKKYTEVHGPKEVKK